MGNVHSKIWRLSNTATPTGVDDEWSGWGWWGQQCWFSGLRQRRTCSPRGLSGASASWAIVWACYFVSIPFSLLTLVSGLYCCFFLRILVCNILDIGPVGGFCFKPFLYFNEYFAYQKKLLEQNCDELKKHKPTYKKSKRNG